MISEQLTAFLDAVQHDASLQAKIKQAADLETVVAIANDAGFQIPSEELMTARAKIAEDELENLSGGRCSTGMITYDPKPQC